MGCGILLSLDLSSISVNDIALLTQILLNTASLNVKRRAPAPLRSNRTRGDDFGAMRKSAKHESWLTDANSPAGWLALLPERSVRLAHAMASRIEAERRLWRGV